MSAFIRSIWIVFVLLYAAAFTVVASLESELFGLKIQREVLHTNQLKFDAFKKISVVIDEHFASTGEWLSEDSIKKLGDQHSVPGAWMHNIELRSSYGMPNELKPLGEVPKNSYLLYFSDDGVAYYYAAWSMSTNMAITEFEVYAFGSLLKNRVVYFLIFLLSVFILTFLGKSLYKKLE